MDKYGFTGNPYTSPSSPTPSNTSSGQTTQSVTAGSPGIISAVSHRFQSGEIYVTVTVRNTDSITHEYRAYLYSADGDRMDKEPDTYWKNVKPGQTYTFNLSTNYKWGDASDLAGGYRVTILLEGGIFVDERFVNLSDGQVTDPGDRQPGTPTDPDTAPGVGGTPALPGEDEPGFFENLFSGGGSSGATNNIVLIGGLIIIGGLLLSKK